MIKDLRFDRSAHGSLYDRGASDSHYGRDRSPHWYKNGIRLMVSTEKEIAEYNAGYDENEKSDTKKIFEEYCTTC